jgi:transcriptional regulator with XRE-family HTH domain
MMVVWRTARPVTPLGRCEVSTADDAKPFGMAVRRRRVAAGLSLSDLARRVHYSKSHLSKVETGRRAPSLDLARRCDVALAASGALVSLLPVETATATALPVEPAGDQWLINVDSSGHGGFSAAARRSSSIDPSASPLTWAMPSSTGKWDHRVSIDSFRLIFEELRHAGHTTTPATLLPVLIAQTHALRLIASTSRPRTRSAALLLAGRFAEYTGWLAQEAGDDRGALWWTDRAVEFAAASGDRDLTAYALVRRGLIAMYRYDASETVAVAERAQAARCSARIGGLAALREAQGHALAGAYDRCRRALDRAATLLDSTDATPPGQPVLGTTTVADPVAMVTGWCLYDLGRPRRAVELLRSELASVPDFAYRTRARIGVRYALALLAAGELEYGCVVVGGILDVLTQADSATTRVDLRRLAQELNRQSSHRSVRELMPRMTVALSTGYR